MLFPHRPAACQTASAAVADTKMMMVMGVCIACSSVRVLFFFCFAPPIARLIHATARQADRTAKRVPRNMCPAPAYAAARPQMRMYLNIDMILLRKQHTLGQHKHTQNDLRKRHQFPNLMHKSSVCVCVFALCTQPDDDDGHVDDRLCLLMRADYFSPTMLA